MKQNQEMQLLQLTSIATLILLSSCLFFITAEATTSSTASNKHEKQNDVATLDKRCDTCHVFAHELQNALKQATETDIAEAPLWMERTFNKFLNFQHASFFLRRPLELVLFVFLHPEDVMPSVMLEAVHWVAGPTGGSAGGGEIRYWFGQFLRFFSFGYSTTDYETHPEFARPDAQTMGSKKKKMSFSHPGMVRTKRDKELEAIIQEDNTHDVRFFEWRNSHLYHDGEGSNFPFAELCRSRGYNYRPFFMKFISEALMASLRNYKWESQQHALLARGQTSIQTEAHLQSRLNDEHIADVFDESGVLAVLCDLHTVDFNEDEHLFGAATWKRSEGGNAPKGGEVKEEKNNNNKVMIDIAYALLKIEALLATSLNAIQNDLQTGLFNVPSLTGTGYVHPVVSVTSLYSFLCKRGPSHVLSMKTDITKYILPNPESFNLPYCYEEKDSNDDVGERTQNDGTSTTKRKRALIGADPINDDEAWEMWTVVGNEENPLPEWKRQEFKEFYWKHFSRRVVEFHHVATISKPAPQDSLANNVEANVVEDDGSDL